MSKHTPGPWFVSASGPTVYALHGQPQRNRFSATMQGGRSDDAPLLELVANARLIAAAPELLEALRGLDEAYCRAGSPLSKAERHEDRLRLIAARAAIAKATGEA